jgi:hypothetical protein
MKTLLVYPEFPDTYWSFRHALSLERVASSGATYAAPLPGIARSLRRRSGWPRRAITFAS